MSGSVRKVRIQSVWVKNEINKKSKINQINNQLEKNANKKNWNAEGPCGGEKNSQGSKNKSLKTCKTKGSEVEKILERSRRTISRMLCKRHRKSFYCRHCQQLWGNKKKITSVTFFQPQVLVNHVQSFSCFSDMEHWRWAASFLWVHDADWLFCFDVWRHRWGKTRQNIYWWMWGEKKFGLRRWRAWK